MRLKRTSTGMRRAWSSGPSLGLGKTRTSAAAKCLWRRWTGRIPRRHVDLCRLTLYSGEVWAFAALFVASVWFGWCWYVGP